MRKDTVSIQDDRVVITDLVITDPNVLHYLQESTDPVQELRALLVLGVHVAMASTATLDANLVERRFEEIARRMKDSVDESVNRVAAASNELLNEDNGSLTTTINALHAGVESMLAEHFDPNSRQSVMASIEKVLTEHAEKQQHRMQQTLANGPGTPLGAIKTEVLDAVHRSNDQLRSLIEEVTRTIAVQKAEHQVREKGSAKGFAFEDLVLDRVQYLASPNHDVAEKVGGGNGSVPGSKKGDLLLTYANLPAQVNPRLVIEAKDKQLSMKVVREELNGALENRDAGVAIIVFASQQQAPTKTPFHVIGERQAVVVVDKETGSDPGLQVAYLWARWVLQRGTITDHIEYERIDLTMQRLTETLQQMAEMKKANTTISTKVKYLDSTLDLMATTIQEQVKELSSMLTDNIAA